MTRSCVFASPPQSQSVTDTIFYGLTQGDEECTVLTANSFDELPLLGCNLTASLCEGKIHGTWHHIRKDYASTLH